MSPSENNGTFLPFEVLNHSRHQKHVFATFPSPLSPVLFACLFFFPLSSSFTSLLHSSPANSLISRSQFKQGVQPIRPSPIYFSYTLFFSFFFPPLQSSCVLFDRRCRFFDRQTRRSLLLTVSFPPSITREINPFTQLFVLPMCKYRLIFV